MGYEDYLKKFYPHQVENVFTQNNWTLSDELVQVLKSNIFYIEHIRWNVQRYRPADVVSDIGADNSGSSSATQVPLSSERETTSDIRQTMTQQPETTDGLCQSPRPKRKGPLSHDSEQPTRIQPSRCKKLC